MDPKLQQVVADYIQTLLAYTKQGIDFAKDQIPLVITEKLHFALAWNIVWLVAGIVIIVFGYALFRKAVKYDEWDTPLSLFALIIPAIGVGIFFSNLYYILMILLAPRLYIIEWITSLIRDRN